MKINTISTNTALWINVMKNAVHESFGNRLARLRRDKGFTQTELGEAIGVSQRVISYYERETKKPASKLLPQIARVLGVSTDELLGLDKAMPDARTRDARLLRKFKEVEKLPASDRKAIIQVIDAMVAKKGS